MAPQTLVPPATTFNNRVPRPKHLQLLLPPSARRPQLPRHVHPRHGLRDLYSPLHAPGRPKRGIPPRSHGLHIRLRHLHRPGGNRSLETRNIHPLHKQRLAAPRPGSLLRLQIRWRDPYARRLRNHQRRPRNRRLGRLDNLYLHIPRKRFLPRKPALLLVLLILLTPSPPSPPLSSSRSFHIPPQYQTPSPPFQPSTLTHRSSSTQQLRSLKYVLLPDSSSTPTGSGMTHTVARSQRNRRTQFLFVYSYVVQFVFMWILTRQDSISGVGGTAKS